MTEQARSKGDDPPRPLIYLVDDTAELTELVEPFLTAAGYATRRFASPQQALQALSAADPLPDLLVTDYQMPGMNGMQLIQRCKQVHPALKTISASGTLTDDIVRGYAVRPDRLLPKPYFADQLLRAIKEVLG